MHGVSYYQHGLMHDLSWWPDSDWWDSSDPMQFKQPVEHSFPIQNPCIDKERTNVTIPVPGARSPENVFPKGCLQRMTTTQSIRLIQGAASALSHRIIVARTTYRKDTKRLLELTEALQTSKTRQRNTHKRSLGQCSTQPARL